MKEEDSLDEIERGDDEEVIRAAAAPTEEVLKAGD